MSLKHTPSLSPLSAEQNELLSRILQELTAFKKHLHRNFLSNSQHKPVKVHFSDGAFLAILTSSVEVYPSEYMDGVPRIKEEGEVLGYLYGKVEESHSCVMYDVLGVSVQQNYDYRTECSCCPDVKASEKMHSITDAIPDLLRIGCFHSHPYIYSDFTSEFCSHWSDTDLKSTLASVQQYDAPPLEVIFALSYLNSEKKRSPHYYPSYLVNFCKRFKFVLRAFVVDINENTLADVDGLSCPLAGRIRNR